MKLFFKKMPYLKFVVVLIGYLLFTAQASTENCDQHFTFDPNNLTVSAPFSYNATNRSTGDRVYFRNYFIMPPSGARSCDNEPTSYFSPSSVYMLIKNGLTILDSVKVSQQMFLVLGSLSIEHSLVFNLPGTYTLQYVVNIEGHRMVGAESNITVTGNIISPGKYKLESFSYTSSGGDTTFNYSAAIDTNNNYLNFLTGFRLDSYLKLPFTAAEKSRYKWLTIDTLKAEYIRGLYTIERTNTIGNYNLSITYQSNKATFNGELSADSLVLRWKYGGNQNAPTFRLKYKR